ncbi:chalcone isomerase family protein [Alteromonas sp. MB-3u-76]|uniref:chalcone isomerase family protein n=1 Tax=Alteromonas sp. MB-3u-76 TaxID=2058133 RepID=UPI0012FD100D|nr:chalcone isomerase family protein [Alteromonas sp. MB-3u-76]
MNSFAGNMPYKSLFLCTGTSSLLLPFLFFLTIHCTNASAADAETTPNSRAEARSIPLVFSGSTIRKRFFFSVYKISHFMAWPAEKSSNPDELIKLIAAGDLSQRVEIEFLRDVSREQVEEALIDGIERNNPGKDLSEIKNDIIRLSEGFDNDITEKSRLVLTRIDKTKLIVHFNEQRIVETDNRELTEALWSIWFGQKPIVDNKALIANQLR